MCGVGGVEEEFCCIKLWSIRYDEKLAAIILNHTHNLNVLQYTADHNRLYFIGSPYRLREVACHVSRVSAAGENERTHAVVVVLADEEDGQVPQRSNVQRLEELALVCRAISIPEDGRGFRATRALRCHYNWVDRSRFT